MYMISKAATLSAITADTLRYYEKDSLITPASKTAAGYRLYDDDALRRIRFIKHGQHRGFTLSDLKELLTLKVADRACRGDVRSLAIKKKRQIQHKLKALRAMSRALDELIGRCEGGEKTTDYCPILGVLETSLRAVSRES
jgi:DNA-binding transcriptional MerR regulator